jgi:alkylation response protein AidB-like acyl-CoA dehydrogenase
MRCGWSDEVEQFSSAVRRFLDHNGGLSRVLELERAGDEFDATLWARLVEEGWTTLWDGGFASTVDDPDGPAGSDVIDAGEAAAIEVGRQLAAVPLGSRLTAGWLIERLRGSDGTGDSAPFDFTPAAASVVAVAISGWGGGTGLQAKVSGDRLVVDGGVGLVRDAAVADAVLAVVPVGHRWAACVLQPGEGDVTVVARRTAGRSRAAAITVASVEVAPHRFGFLDAADLSTVTSLLLLVDGAEQVGMARRLVELSTEHAVNRRQFGQSLIEFQAIRHHIADMHTDSELAAALWHHTAWLLSTGSAADDAASSATLWSRDALRRVVRRAHQIHGGVGFIRDHPLHLFFGRQQAARNELGSILSHREVVWRSVRP